MITQLLVGIFAGIATLVGRLLPDFEAPAFLTSTLPGLVDEMAAYLAGANAWLPLDQVAVVLGFIAFALGIAVTVKVARIVASFATFGGGSAA